MTTVLDSSAVIAMLWNEPGGKRVRDLLADEDELVLIHAVNLIEVLYRLRRPRRARDAITTVDVMAASRVQVIRNVDEALQTIAVDLKATQTPIALGDTFAVALAMVRGATLVTTDRGELQKVADAGLCDIEFLR